jgi:hypothetical protein
MEIIAGGEALRGLSAGHWIFEWKPSSVSRSDVVREGGALRFHAGRDRHRL